MIIVYTFLTIIFIIIGKVAYKNFINPICIYSLVWEIALLIHQSGLVVFYELRPFTWFVIIFMQILFICGCIVSLHFKTRIDDYEPVIRQSVQKKYLKRFIIITIVVAGIAIIGNYFLYARVYGLNLIDKVTQIYSDRVNNVISIPTIPYLGAFILLVPILIGIYFRKYGFTMWIIPAFLLAFIQMLLTGGRMDFVIFVVLLVLAYLLSDIDKIKILLHSTVFKYVVVFLVFAAFAVILVTNKRASGEVPVYATPLYKTVFHNNVFIYKILTYVGGPIGVLNEYLKECEFHFGQNTFLPIYNTLANIKFCDEIPQYQEFFYTPYHCNVGTWIRELIEDFTFFGGAISVFLFGCVVSKTYQNSRKYQTTRHILLTSVLFLAICLSFFDWRLRSSNIWIVVFFGYIFCHIIDMKSGEVEND